ncbi:MAG: hypothetical protein HY720_26305 [Planctomycetes bacterium]|nr:hypothetical protein [Planctomycetota bacterium]
MKRAVAVFAAALFAASTLDAQEGRGEGSIRGWIGDLSSSDWESRERAALEALSATGSWPIPTQLGRLDAIHLPTALLWRGNVGRSLLLATDDVPLALPARAHGFDVVGV